jgi:hypothetical protein
LRTPGAAPGSANPTRRCPSTALAAGDSSHVAPLRSSRSVDRRFDRGRRQSTPRPCSRRTGLLGALGATRRVGKRVQRVRGSSIWLVHFRPKWAAREYDSSGGANPRRAAKDWQARFPRRSRSEGVRDRSGGW